MVVAKCAMALLSVLALAVAPTWQDTLKKEITLLGHRNWICVVDSAYPAQTSPGIKMIDTRADHVEVLKTVLAAMKKVPHVRPMIYMDQELKFIPDSDAPGISALRRSLDTVLKGRPNISVMPHENIIAKLEEAGKSFQVLMLKTTCVKPYTSVFMELNCGYWTDAAEKRLRAKMGG